jgi:hypothetical protein
MRSAFITFYRENMAFVFQPPIFITASSDTPARSPVRSYVSIAMRIPQDRLRLRN